MYSMAKAWCIRRYLIQCALIVCCVSSGRSAAVNPFRLEPEDASVQRGHTATLYCSVERPSNTTTVGWWSDHINNEPISHNRALRGSSLSRDQMRRFSITGDAARGDFNLQIVNFTDADAANYRCQIFAASTLESYFRFSRSAALTVAPYPPRCYVNSPKSRRQGLPLMVGDTVDLVCESRNPETSARNLRWMYAARTILTGTPSSYPVARSVVTRTLTVRDYDARFMCIELNGRTCFLTPLRRYIPVLIQTADPQPAQVGDTLTYRCIANNDLAPLSYRWLLNGIQLPGIKSEEFTIGPISVSYNGSILECVVRHNTTGFKGNNSVTLKIRTEPIRDPDEFGTSLTDITTYVQPDTSTPRDDDHPLPVDVKPSPSLTPGLQGDAVLGIPNGAEDGTWDGLYTPFVICISVIGVLLAAVLILLTVFIVRQRTSTRRVTDAAKTKDGAPSSLNGPTSDRVPLDYVTNKGMLINGSPSVSIGTLKGFKNPASCGSVDTFEMDLDPDGQPEYFTLEHPAVDNLYEGIYAGLGSESEYGKSEEGNVNNEHGDIEVSDTITPDCELTARNRGLGLGSSPLPPVPSALPQVSMIVPPEFEGDEAQAESLVAAYAITNVARSLTGGLEEGRPSHLQHTRSSSLNRPLPARPIPDGGYRSPTGLAANEKSSHYRRFGSLRACGGDELALVGALARSNSFKRPLPAMPNEDVIIASGPCTPDPYRAPRSIFASIPPSQTSRNSVPGTDVPGTDAPGTDAPRTDKPRTDAPPVVEETRKLDVLPDEPLHDLRTVPKKYKVTVQGLSAVTGEGDYAEIDSDQEQANETDHLIGSSNNNNITSTTSDLSEANNRPQTHENNGPNSRPNSTNGSVHEDVGCHPRGNDGDNADEKKLAKLSKLTTSNKHPDVVDKSKPGFEINDVISVTNQEQRAELQVIPTVAPTGRAS